MASKQNKEVNEIKWEDIWCTAILDVRKEGAPQLEFEVYEWAGTDAGGENPSYVLNDGKGSTFTEDISKAESLVCGRIKWDACSHVYFGSEGGYIHLCGDDSWRTLREVLKRVFNYARENIMQNHSKDMFGESPL